MGSEQSRQKVHSTYAIQDDEAQKRAVRNYHRKLACYHPAYHGDYQQYVYQIQGEYELECLSPVVTRGGASYSRFDD